MWQLRRGRRRRRRWMSIGKRIRHRRTNDGACKIYFILIIRERETVCVCVRYFNMALWFSREEWALQREAKPHWAGWNSAYHTAPQPSERARFFTLTSLSLTQTPPLLHYFLSFAVTVAIVMYRNNVKSFFKHTIPSFATVSLPLVFFLLHLALWYIVNVTWELIHIILCPLRSHTHTTAAAATRATFNLKNQLFYLFIFCSALLFAFGREQQQQYEQLLLFSFALSLSHSCPRYWWHLLSLFLLSLSLRSFRVYIFNFTLNESINLSTNCISWEWITLLRCRCEKWKIPKHF